MLFKDDHARKHAGDAVESSRQNAEKIAEQERLMRETQQEVHELDRKLDSITRSNSELTAQTQKILEAVRELKDDVEEEMNSLKLSKNRMLSTVVEKVQQEMQELTAAVRTDYDSYLGIRKELAALSSRLSLLTQDIDKFKAISSTIKGMDFELKSYARILEEKDSEKLRLLRRIEDLQKIISRERRDRPSTFRTGTR